MEIFEALEHVEGGDGSYLAVKVWEIDLMIRLQKTADEYGGIPVAERALMIADKRLPDWMGILQQDKDYKEAQKKK